MKHDHAALASVIWEASRADEGTISATGANIVAHAVIAHLTKESTRRVSHEKLVKMEFMVKDGCSVKEICETVGVGYRTVKRHFPHAGWTTSEAGRFGAMVRHTQA